VLGHKKIFLLILALSLAACLPHSADLTPAPLTATQTPGPTPTLLPSRPEYDPGELVDYVAQSGDTLPALAARFNTTIQEIRDANPDIDIPADATTMPPGMPMKIPIYYLPFWGTTFQILPDSQFVNGPAAIGFDTGAFVASHPGWLKDFRAYAGGANHSGAEIVDMVATNYSISPRVLLAILEYQTGALSRPVPPSGNYPLGDVDYTAAGLYLQLIWAADLLNNGYYGWRTGSLTEFEHLNGNIERPDPWQTAATVAFQYYYSIIYSPDDYTRAIGPGGLARTYINLFGDPWEVDRNNPPLIPASLQQPELTFPFPAGNTWSLTGGPHNGWGNSLLLPWAALDFGPPDVNGCTPTTEVATAVANGVVVRSETGVVMLDLNGDNDERTGWDVLYLHVATTGRAPAGRSLKVGDPVGYPSCEGGEATGTHLHIARKYNGEWIPVDSAVSFNLDGWIAHIGNAAYQGTLTRGNQTIIACACSDAASQVKAGK
jgi:LasA protease